MLNYYQHFWERNKAVKTAPMLEILPRSLFVDIQTEIFWTFLNKCYFLKRTTASFKRAIATKIKIEVLNRGDTLYELNKVSENVYYIARGNVDILSSEDGSSSIVSLGKGTCLGQIHLLQRTVTRFKAMMASYAVVYILNKRDFWMEVYKYRKLNVGSAIQDNFLMKIDQAVQATRQNKKVDNVELLYRKWKCVVSKKILTRFKENIKRPNQKEWFKLGIVESEDPDKLYTYSDIHSQKTYDEIFLGTSFPWILQQNSQFLTLWNAMMIVVICYVSVSFPYQAAFMTDFSITIVHVISAFYVLDVIFQLFTAIDTKLDVIRKVGDIALYRLESVRFIVDLIAAIPFYLIAITCDLEGYHQRIVYIFTLTKLFKIYRVDDVFKKLEKNPQINNTFLRSVKNVLYLSYFGFICGCLYYMITCFGAPDLKFGKQRTIGRLKSVYAVLFILFYLEATIFPETQFGGLEYYVVELQLRHLLTATKLDYVGFRNQIR